MSDPIQTHVIPLSGTRFGNLRFDAIAGFLVFLIAMPLCLAIAQASGFPPIAGIWTAVIGGILTACLSNAELTIKGPAAGLIVIVAGAVTEFGASFGGDLPDTERALLGYRLTLGVGVAAGLIQMLFGVLRAGRLAEFFPLTPVHGMLASIGLIIISKQIYQVIGVAAPKHEDGSSYEPLELFGYLPQAIPSLNPAILSIGIVSLLILFGLPFVAQRFPVLKKVPSQLVVLIVAMVLGSTMLFDLDHKHSFLFPNHMTDGHLENGEYELGPKFLVSIPNVLAEPSKAFAFPDFRGLATVTGLKFLLLFTLIGSLESLLSAKAVELIDPWKRKTNFDRDLLAVGVANTLTAFVGGLPMISEIVRSKANIDNGARTRWANAFHGVFLLAFVLLFPDLIHRIPLAALGAMLIYTGFRLANPGEFVRAYKIGFEQIVVFVGTIIATLATDLLIGIGVGIALKIMFHLIHGCPINSIFKADIESVPDDNNGVTVIVRRAAVFSNWLDVQKTIRRESEGRESLTVDLSKTRLVDHSTMEKLHELEREWNQSGKSFAVIGLDRHTALSPHPLAARKQLQVTTRN